MRSKERGASLVPLQLVLLKGGHVVRVGVCQAGQNDVHLPSFGGVHLGNVFANAPTRHGGELGGQSHEDNVAHLKELRWHHLGAPVVGAAHLAQRNQRRLGHLTVEQLLRGIRQQIPQQVPERVRIAVGGALLELLE